MPGNLFGRIAAYPFWMQILLYLALMLAAIVVFGLLALLSPFVMMLAGLVLIAAIFALVVCFLRRRPLMRWGLVAVMSLVVLLVFTGISNALYFSEQAEQANLPERENQTSKPHTDPESQEQEHEAAEQPVQRQREPVQANADTKARPSARESGASVTVKRAVDGETINISPSVDGKDTVRLIGIDAPEKEKPGCAAQPLAQEAADKLANWEGSKVRLEFEEDRTDERGRLLAYVHDDAPGDITLNEEMLRSGYAQLWILAPNTKYEDELRAAQREAREDPVFGTSIWALSPSEQDQLADHGNGIGEGDGACPLFLQENTMSASSSASSSVSPNLGENNNVPGYSNGSRNAAGYSSSTAAPVSPAPTTPGPPTLSPASAPASASASASP